ncbi:GNAT family N-acetyltransferase [Psychrosphaera algicola]|uniref:GNAT family N-acetyltransferase n=1 Tax=Psychrosphaera algicola TaxID=3023714 RepID=A0ABT5FFF7_9GAMM|nr:GNAT family N-acetyltransferase [Psychrosphaera sp. G1-22]MDC2889789.1 GNAT family N-acetyltransferase [Psychrosphaera sp. G1-22]
MRLSQQRGLLWLAGEADWTLNWLSREFNAIDSDKPLDIVRFGSRENNQSTFHQVHDIRTKQYKKQLGQESDIIMFDAFAGFNPDAFGALAGTVRRGGLVILVTPSIEHWPMFADPELNRVCVEPFKFDQIEHHFIQRLVTLLTAAPSVIKIFQSEHSIVDQLAPVRLQSIDVKTDINVKQGLDFGCITTDQTNAVTSILALANQNQKRALVLTADRGRGKSTSLAIAAWQLIEAKLSTCSTNEADLTIVLTCPLVDSVSGLMSHFYHLACASQSAVERSGNSIYSNRQSPYEWQVKFVAPDQLALLLPDANYVLIDEAAAIPIQMLSPVFNHYSCCILASTQHGYEGTGRGFEYKLKPALHTYFETVEYIELSQPIRWSAHDNLEPIVNRLLALDVELADITAIHTRLTPHVPATSGSEANALTQLNIYPVEQAELANNITLTDQIFALLVHAHYRTSPNDLRLLLDSPNMTVWLAEDQGVVVAAALVAKEGEIEGPLAEQICQGRRRPRGHLFPQSLLNHGGFKHAGNYHYSRIVRIAVHPKLQSFGIGSKLVSTIEAYSIATGVDFLCTSFGLTESLLRFWKNNRFVAARLGLKPEASTGELSLMMWKCLTSASRAFYNTVNQRFVASLTTELKFIDERKKWLTESWFTALFELDITQSNKCPEIPHTLTNQDMVDLTYLTQHFRLPDNCLLALYRLTKQSKANDLLSAWFNDGLSRAELQSQFGLSSDKQWQSAVRQAVQYRMNLM